MRRNTKFNNLSGKRFGKLVCLSQGEFCGNHRTWICKCDCGNIHRTLATNLLSRKIKSCGCLGSSCGKNNINWKGYEEISGQYWNSLKTNAKRRKIKFSILIKDAWKLYLTQNKKCALSDIPLSFSENKKEKSKATASLDRIDSSKGYILGNVQWVHKDINFMKMDLPEEYFIEICNKIVSHRAIVKNKSDI
jgi:hypothetical protein